MSIRAATLAVTGRTWEYDFGFMQGINGRTTSHPFLSFLIPATSQRDLIKNGRKNEAWDLEFLLYESYSMSDPTALAAQIDKVRQDLLTFIEAFADRTVLYCKSPVKLRQLGNSNDQNKEVCVSAKFTVEVTNCD